MDFPFEINCLSENDTVSLAKEFSEILEEGELIVLTGNLGTGKTFFVKEVLKNFNIGNVTSPSFSIVNEYHGNQKFYHFDFYRLKNIKELSDIGFQDYLNDSESIIFIEWGELFEDILPKNHIKIVIENLGDSKRKFTIIKYE